MLSFLLLACSGEGVPPGAPVDTGVPTDDTASIDDSATEDSGTAPEAWTWTEGPALPDCTPQTGAGDLVALSGVLLLPEGPTAGVVVYSRTSGLLTCVGECDTTAADVLCTEGVVSPGLIDAHDHLQYNVLAPWRHDGLFTDRYEWQSDPSYWEFGDAFDAIENDYACEIMKWAELRVLVGGGTSAVGSSGDACIRPLVRNLDEGIDEHFLADYDLTYSSGAVTSYYDEADAASFADDLASGESSAQIFHVAEGVGGSVRREIDFMLDLGMALPGQAFVHATDATTDELARIRQSGAGILWSPRSNLDLYGATTEADVALKLGVPVALGPDWTWSGSAHVPDELECAVDYLRARDTTLTDADVWAMSTHDAARIVGLDGLLGTLEPGLGADIAVFPWSSEPYRSVIEAGPGDVRLVVVAGQALYGVDALVAPTTPHPEWCESVDACGQAHLVCVRSADKGDDSATYTELESTLTAALGSTDMPAELDYANDLFPIFQCADERPSCDPRAPTATDGDGDGFEDAVDVCPLAWDPLQRDHDQDGLGDPCDPCPLAPDLTTCAHDADDVDGDGFTTAEDVCPTIHDPSQADADGDHAGDACDLCPDEPSAGGPCLVAIATIRNPADPDHPAEGTLVATSGVVTGVGSNGFFLQDPTAESFGGIFVYGTSNVAAGDVVTASGTYTEYYGLSEIELSVASVTGTASGTGSVEAITATACELGTGGTLAESHESMLVRVIDVVVTDKNPDTPDDYGEMEVGGCLRVDDLFYDGFSRTLDDEYDAISGILNYAYGNTKLEPRSAVDFE